MDFATLIGLVTGTSLLLWAIMGRTNLGAFIDPGSIAIVIGGSFSAVMVSFPIKTILGMFKVTKNCFFTKARDPRVLIADMVRFAEVARRDGILALENATSDVSDPFLISGIQMAVDGTDPDLIESVMVNDMETIEARHSDGKAIFDSIGRYAPAFTTSSWKRRMPRRAPTKRWVDVPLPATVRSAWTRTGE